MSKPTTPKQDDTAAASSEQEDKQQQQSKPEEDNKVVEELSTPPPESSAVDDNKAAAEEEKKEGNDTVTEEPEKQSTPTTTTDNDAASVNISVESPQNAPAENNAGNAALETKDENNNNNNNQDAASFNLSVDTRNNNQQGASSTNEYASFNLSENPDASVLSKKSGDEDAEEEQNKKDEESTQEQEEVNTDQKKEDETQEVQENEKGKEEEADESVKYSTTKADESKQEEKADGDGITDDDAPPPPPPPAEEEAEITPHEEHLESNNQLPPSSNNNNNNLVSSSDDDDEAPATSAPVVAATSSPASHSTEVSAPQRENENGDQQQQNELPVTSRTSRSHSVVSGISDAESGSPSRRSSSRKHSFMDNTLSSSRRRNHTPHNNQDKLSQSGRSSKKPAWRPSSKVPNLIRDARRQAGEDGGPDFVKNNATTLGGSKERVMGFDKGVVLPPIKQTYSTNLFQQLHIVIHGRNAIGVKTNDGSRSKMFKKAVNTGTGDNPYALIPPAAQNSANNFQIPAALLMPTVSTLNTSVTANAPRNRGKNSTSVLSVLCLTGSSENDSKHASVSTCLRCIPCEADHRSIAVERVVPALPREGARFVGTFLGEDSTFLSRQMLTYDAVAAWEEDWTVMADLVAGDYLSASLTQGITRSGVVLFQSGPESESVTNAFCDGTQPFLNRMSEVLIQACNRHKKNSNNNNNNKNQENEEGHDTNDEEEQNNKANPLMKNASPPSDKKKKEKLEANKRGPQAAAAATLSSLHNKNQPDFTRSVNQVLSSSSPTGAASSSSPPRGSKAPTAGLNSHQQGGLEFTTIESLIEAYSFDYVAVSGLDINPGVLALDKEAVCDDEITDIVSQNSIVLTQRKRHVPFKHHAVPVWCLPNDELPGHQFHNGNGKFHVITPPKSPAAGGGGKNFIRANIQKAAVASSPTAANKNRESSSPRKTSFVGENGDEQEAEEETGLDLETYNATAVHNVEEKVINKGRVNTIDCRTAGEISEAVAKLMKSQAPGSGCHRIITFTLRKNQSGRHDDEYENQSANNNSSPRGGAGGRKQSTLTSSSETSSTSPGKKKKKITRKSSTQVEPKHLTIDNHQSHQSSFHLTYEPTIMFVFLSPNFRKEKSVLAQTFSKEPHINRAILRDHKEIFQCLEHLSKYDGMGKEQCMLQPFEFEGALANILSTYAWLRPDCCKTAYIGTAKAFSESPDETNNVLLDVDRVKRYPVHPRAVANFSSHGLPAIELPALVAKQAAQILGKNVVAASPRHQSPKQASPPKGSPKFGNASPRKK